MSTFCSIGERKRLTGLEQDSHCFALFSQVSLQLTPTDQMNQQLRQHLFRRRCFNYVISIHHLGFVFGLARVKIDVTSSSLEKTVCNWWCGATRKTVNTKNLSSPRHNKTRSAQILNSAKIICLLEQTAQLELFFVYYRIAEVSFFVLCVGSTNTTTRH